MPKIGTCNTRILVIPRNEVDKISTGCFLCERKNFTESISIRCFLCIIIFDFINDLFALEIKYTITHCFRGKLSETIQVRA